MATDLKRVVVNDIIGRSVIKMKSLWNVAQAVFAAFGGVLGWFFGEMNGTIYMLLAFVACDYITGVFCAAYDKRLSSAIGFVGIAKKVLIFIFVGIGHLADKFIFGAGDTLRTAVVFFYLSNEGVSILENSTHLGLPVPNKLKEVLYQLHDKHKNNESEDNKNE